MNAGPASLFETAPIYCDEAIFEYRGGRWAHLFSPSVPALHAFAKTIGLQQRWFQAPPKASWPHYDVSEKRRQAAIQAGALPVDRYFCIEIAGRLNGESGDARVARWARIRERRHMSDKLHFGVTGTQGGGTMPQLRALGSIMRRARDRGYRYFHHGDCIGFDAQAHVLAVGFGFHVIIHPPSDPGKRAWCRAPTILDPKPYLERNDDIVQASAVMIGGPAEFEEQVRSGTWATVRRTRKAGKPHYLVYPDGTEQFFPRKQVTERSLFSGT